MYNLVLGRAKPPSWHHQHEGVHPAATGEAKPRPLKAKPFEKEMIISGTLRSMHLRYVSIARSPEARGGSDEEPHEAMMSMSDDHPITLSPQHP
jgi:hypothetical protein